MNLPAIDAHLHIQSRREAPTVLRAMDTMKIEAAILMGSPRFTITLRPSDGFTLYHENNLELLQLTRDYPGRFYAWPTLDPTAPDHLARFQEYVEQGATGLKLYIGHGYSRGEPPEYLFHSTAINSDALAPLYAFCEDRRLPICLHINTTPKFDHFRLEFESVLERFPRLKVNAPHWMLATRRSKYLREVFARFPHLRTDISFGQDQILLEGFRNIAINRVNLRALMLDFPDRFLFGCDLVCTEAAFKTAEWMTPRVRAYRDLLTEKEFKCPLTQETRKGLELPEPVLRRVFRENALALLEPRR